MAISVYLAPNTIPYGDQYLTIEYTATGDNEWITRFHDVVWYPAGTNADKFYFFDSGNDSTGIFNQNQESSRQRIAPYASGYYDYVRNGTEYVDRFFTARTESGSTMYLSPYSANGARLTASKNPMLSTDTIIVTVDPQPTPVPGWVTLSYALTAPANSGVVISRIGTSNQFYVSYNDYSLAVNKTVLLTGTVSGTGRGTGTLSLTIEPSLTGIQITSPNPQILDYSNGYTTNITAIPLPAGTGAPVKYKFALANAGHAPYVGVNPGGTTTSQSQVWGITNIQDPIPVNVTAYLGPDEAPTVSYTATVNVYVRPNTRIWNGSWRNGQPYIWNGSWRTATEVWEWNGSWQRAKVN